MSRVQLSLQAANDLEEIEDFISRDNPAAAARLLLNVLEKFQLLSQHPALGYDRSELRPKLRGFPVGNYIVFYLPANDGIEVVRVLHGARDVPKTF